MNTAFVEEAPHVNLLMCDEYGREHILEEVSTERD